jgi:HNH endonuclease
VHAHHIVSRSRGGSDDPENRVALCACHHLRGVHGGYMRVWGLAPDQLVWEVGGRIWKDGDFGAGAAAEEAREA